MVFLWDYIYGYVPYDKKLLENWLGFRQPFILHNGYCEDTLQRLKMILDVLKYKDVREDVITPSNHLELSSALSRKLLHQNDLSYPALYVSIPDKSCEFLFCITILNYNT